VEVKDKSMRRKLARQIGLFHRINFANKSEENMIFLHKVVHDVKLYEKFIAKCDADYYTQEQKSVLKELRCLASTEEREFFRRMIPKTKEIVLCHNDIHQENVIVLTKNLEPVIIDYEMADYNFRGFDIANFFSECTFECNEDLSSIEIREDYYPTDKEMIEILRYYLVFYKSKVEFSVEMRQRLVEDDAYFAEVEKEVFPNDEEKEKLIEELLQEIKVGGLLSHYYWAIWSVVEYKPAAFDYIKFAEERCRFYKKIKQTL